MTIFTIKGGKLEPIAVIKGGKTVSYRDFIAQAGEQKSGEAAKK
jgi:hypothetical protein